MSAAAKAVPPALFDLDEASTSTSTSTSEVDLHSGLDEARAQWAAAGYCTAATFDHDEDGHWTRTHLCTGRLGHDGQHKCDRCARTWGCISAWDSAHPFLKHSHHRCIFGGAPHRRHSCRCGLETFEVAP